MIKVVFKNKETEIFDGDGFEVNGAFIIMTKKEHEIGLIAGVEIRAISVDCEETKKESVEDIEFRISEKVKNNLKKVEEHMEELIEVLRNADDSLYGEGACDYKSGYRNGIRDYKRQLKGVHLLIK